MVEPIIFVAFLLGGIYAIHYGVRFTLQLIFERKPKNWITRNYKRHSGVNFGKVNRVVVAGLAPTEDFSHWEMVAVFGLLLLKTEIPDTIRKAEVFSDQGWRNKFNYDFYNEIAIMAKKISAQGHKKSARELIMFGQRLAEMYDEKTWLEDYKKILDGQLAESSNLEWDFTRGVNK